MNDRQSEVKLCINCKWCVVMEPIKTYELNQLTCSHPNYRSVVDGMSRMDCYLARGEVMQYGYHPSELCGLEGKFWTT